jgi:cob(I)alamin adenosyltransferase
MGCGGAFMIHVYYGTGKGKTTASIGLAVRAAGCGKRVYVGHFLKDHGLRCGEDEALKALSDRVTVERYQGQCHPMFCSGDAGTVDSIAESVNCAVERVEGFIDGNLFDLVVLDELLNALEAGLVSLDKVIHVIDRSGDIELVLTGRTCHNDIMIRADYVSRIDEVKHPWRRGITAREGVEY